MSNGKDNILSPLPELPRIVRSDGAMEDNGSISNHSEKINHFPFGGELTPISKIPSRLRFTDSPTTRIGLIKAFTPEILEKTTKTSDSGEEFKNPKALLNKYRKESSLLAEIHTKSSLYCESRNQFCTLFALTLSLLCSVVDPILQRYAEDIQKIFTTASFALIGGLNVMFNFLAWQQKSEHHKQARDAHRQIVEIVELAFAYSAEKEYDFNKVLNEIRQIHTNLTKITPPIPGPISLKYEKILSPSLLKSELKELKKIENNKKTPHK
uniref:SMODS and SLOG-associating 2TM effector domain-containing protein n=1 Tax=viral metagenome TaxID=1070528 RepID=A0A6C0LLV1_9ZZZZ